MSKIPRNAKIICEVNNVKGERKHAPIIKAAASSQTTDIAKTAYFHTLFSEAF
jgi:hypothetical protein